MRWFLAMLVLGCGGSSEDAVDVFDGARHDCAVYDTTTEVAPGLGFAILEGMVSPAAGETSYDVATDTTRVDLVLRSTADDTRVGAVVDDGSECAWAEAIAVSEPTVVLCAFTPGCEGVEFVDDRSCYEIVDDVNETVACPCTLDDGPPLLCEPELPELR